MIGRRGPVEASFTSGELAELGHLARAVPVIEGAEVPQSSGAEDPAVAKVKDKNLEIMRGFAGNVAGSKPITLHLCFNQTPLAIEGDGRVERLVLQNSGGGGRHSIAVDTVITAIGYRAPALQGVALDQSKGVVINQGGEIAPGLYVVGWAKRGPSGVIATNRADSLAVAERIVAYVKMQTPKADSSAAFDALLQSRGANICDFAQWQALDRSELAAGKAMGRPRRKIVSPATI